MLTAHYDMRSQESALLAAAKLGPLQSLTDRELALREQPLTIYPHALQWPVWAWVRFGPESIRVAAKVVRSTPAAAGIEFRAGDRRSAGGCGVTPCFSRMRATRRARAATL